MKNFFTLIHTAIIALKYGFYRYPIGNLIFNVIVFIPRLNGDPGVVDVNLLAYELSGLEQQLVLELYIMRTNVN